MADNVEDQNKPITFVLFNDFTNEDTVVYQLNLAGNVFFNNAAWKYAMVSETKNISTAHTQMETNASLGNLAVETPPTFKESAESSDSGTTTDISWPQQRVAEAQEQSNRKFWNDNNKPAMEQEVEALLGDHNFCWDNIDAMNSQWNIDKNK